MRGIGLIAGTALLASCGSQEREDASELNTELPAQEPNGANEALAPQNATEATNATAEVSTDSGTPCLVQGDERLDVQPVRAVGTEPFWSARVEGRCVTYSTPEDQQGTRVWTRYSARPNGGGGWVGQLGGKTFEMRIRLEPGCSDGMSDKSYPIAVDLTVGGEQRRGCAEPL